MGRSAQPMKHENTQKIPSKISPNFSPNSSPRISPGHKNLSPHFVLGNVRPKSFTWLEQILAENGVRGLSHRSILTGCK